MPDSSLRQSTEYVRSRSLRRRASASQPSARFTTAATSISRASLRRSPCCSFFTRKRTFAPPVVRSEIFFGLALDAYTSTRSSKCEMRSPLFGNGSCGAAGSAPPPPPPPAAAALSLAGSATVSVARSGTRKFSSRT